MIFPDRNEKFAEFIGIMTGEGYIGQYKLENRTVSSLEITGNRLKDFDYLKIFVNSLINELFNITPNFYEREDQNTLRLIIYSKEITEFLNELGFPLGQKGDISAPSWVINEELFFKNFIRGLFDTDGHVCFKSKEGKKYPVIGLASKSKILLAQIQEFLRLNNINSYLGKNVKRNSITYKLEINGKNNVELFYQLIGSNNKRNKTKYGEMTMMGHRGVEPRTP